MIRRSLVLCSTLGLCAQEPPPPAPPVPAPVPVPQPPAPGVRPASEAEKQKPLAGVTPFQGSRPVKEVIINFSNAKLFDIIQQIARVEGLNYTIDPAVKDGTVRLFMNGKLEKGNLSDVLALALKLQGVAVVRNGDFLEFVPVQGAVARAGTPMYQGTQAPEGLGQSFVAIQVVPLRFIDADAFASFAKEFMTHDGKALVDKGQNVVLFQDYIQNLTRILDFVQLMDKQPFEQKKIALIRLKNASPDHVLKELEPILKASNVPIGTGALQLLPIQSLNAILLVTQVGDWIPDIQGWIDRFDDQPRGEEGEIFMISVRYAKAEVLYPLVAQILHLSGAGTQGARASNLVSPNLAPARSVGSPAGFQQQLGVTGSATGVAGSPFGATAGSQGTSVSAFSPAPQPTQTAVAATPQGTGPTANPAQPGASNGPLSPSCTVTVDPDNNTLIVFGSRRDAALVQVAVDKLDRMPRQVLLEATILDLSMSGDFEFGFSGYLQSHFDPSAVSVNGAPGGPFTSDARIDRPGFTDAFTFTGVFTSGKGLVKAILTAKDSKKNVNLVSQPRLWALDNRPARLLVQDQIPIPVTTFIPGSGTGTGSSGYTVTNAQYLDTGLNITVTPHINANGVIRLEVQQDISSSLGLDTLGSGTNAIQAPRISRRSLSTEFIAPDGATVILGGLIQQNRTHTVTGLPFINRIPILRSLLGSTSSTRDKSELVILITPRIITDTDSLDRVGKEFRDTLAKALGRIEGVLEPAFPREPGDPTVPGGKRESVEKP